MALALVGFLLDKLELLATGKEVELSHGWVAEEALEIKLQLPSMEPFIRDGDARAGNDGAVKVWMKKLRDTVLEPEDVLDEMMLLQPQRLHLLHGLFGLLLRSFSGDDAIGHKLAVRITDINRRLLELSEKRVKCRLQRDDGRSLEDWMLRFRRNGPWDEDEDLVEVKKAREEVMKPLLASEKQLKTVVLLGMGGLGKTTLAKDIYKSHLVKKHFHCQAWITASHGFKTVQQSLMEQFPLSTAEQIGNYLHRKKYLVVLDDLWHFDALADLRKVCLMIAAAVECSSRQGILEWPAPTMAISTSSSP